MNILIVEDDLNKLNEVSDFLEKNITGCAITKAKSYQSGLKCITNTFFDFIVLDMTMPTFDASGNEMGGRPRPFAGRDILKEMKRKSIDIPVIIVTQFETFGEDDDKTTLHELNDNLSFEFPYLYKGSVYYHPAQSDWKIHLFDLITNIMRKEI